MNAYSKDLRLKALAALERGMSRREVLETFDISPATLKRWLRRRREGEDLTPKHSPGRTSRILADVEHRRALWAQLEANDEATLERHCELFEARQGKKVSLATMSRAIRKLGWTFKRRRWQPPSETNKKEVLSRSG